MARAARRLGPNGTLSSVTIIITDGTGVEGSVESVRGRDKSRAYYHEYVAGNGWVELRDGEDT